MKKESTYTSKILKLVKNKYIIATLIFLAFFLFLSKNSIFVTMKLRHDVRQLHQQELRMKEDIRLDSIQAASLEGNADEVERYAREHYFMKRDDEDLFVIHSSEDLDE